MSKGLAVQVRGPAFEREKLGVITSACHPGLGRQTGESVELAGLVGGKELGPRFSERPCLTVLRWRWPPLAFLGALHVHTAAAVKKRCFYPGGNQLTLHLTFLPRIFFISWSDLICCG